MNNKINNTLRGGVIIGGLDLILQLWEGKKQIDFARIGNSTVLGAGLGFGIGTIQDELHQQEWENLTTKKDMRKTKIWQKAKPIFLENPYKVREDKFGNIIHFKEYGNRKSICGWEIDHSRAKSKGGHLTHLNNLQPLQWRENVLKSNK